MWIQRRGDQYPDSAAAEGEGSYIASASDLMIGLLFIFIILVVVLALEQRRKEREIEDQRARLRGAGDPLVVVTKAAHQALKGTFNNVRVDEKTGVISLPEDALFDRGSAQLSQAGRNALGSAAQHLAAALPCFVDSQRRGQDCSQSNPFGHEIETVFIEGHTDSVPFASGTRDNFDLSLARARAVEQSMVLSSSLAGFKNKAGQQVFSFSAYADKRPLPGTDPTLGVNRRVDLRIVLSYKPIDELIPALKPRASEQRP